MNTYIIRYNDIDGNNSLMSDYENIDGKTPQDAIKRRFPSINLRRAYGGEKRFANVIIQKGRYSAEENKIYYSGKSPTICYIKD